MRDNLNPPAKMALVVMTSIAVIAAGWSYFYSRSKRSEVLLFATIGSKPFLDTVYKVRPDGSRLRAVFSPSRGRSYLYASGNSLRDRLIVTVHETNFAGEVVDYLYVNHRVSGEWRRLVTEEGFEGKGVMSPDGSKVVFTLAPTENRGHPTLRITNLQNSETKELTDAEEGTWDGNPSWRPDGEEITFLRSRFTSEGILSNLLRVSPSGGEPRSLLEPPDEPVAAFCYAPDGKRLAIWAKQGLELLETSDGKRTLILPWTKLSNYEYHGGVVWLGHGHRIRLR